jgi:thioredoxin 1
MKITGKCLSIVMLMSISLTGCNANQEPQQEGMIPSAPEQQGAVTRSTSGSVHVSSEQEFQTLSARGNVVIDFYSPACGPCKRLSPMVDAVAREVSHVTFLKVNVEQFRGIASAYAVRGIPTMFFLKDGTQVNFIHGWSGSEQDLKDAVLKYFPA